MKAFLRFTVALLLVLAGLASFAPAQPASAYASATLIIGCNAIYATGTTNQPYVRIAVSEDPSTVGLYVWKFFPVTDGTFSVVLNFPEQPEGKVLWATARGSTNGVTWWDGEAFTFAQGVPCTTNPFPEVPPPSDGRLCRWDNHAVYTTDEHLDVYGISNRQGYFVLRVAQEELDAHPGEEGINTLIKSSEDGVVQVYRLETSDTLQVHAGMDFVSFTGLPAGDVVCGHIELP